METNLPILILGAGNMGGAMAQCWHDAGYDVQLIVRNPQRRAEFEAMGIACFATLDAAPREAGVLVVAIKPQQFPAMQAEIARWCRPETLLMSIMAGITLADLRATSPCAVRVMPNLAARIGESMSLACAPGLEDHLAGLAEDLLDVVGEVAWCAEEEALHLASALAGSGPGFVFAIMDALETAATAQGMERGLATQLVRQMMLGSALLAATADTPPAELARNVASPGGMTQAGLDVLAAEGLPKLMEQVLAAAAARSKQLAG